MRAYVANDDSGNLDMYDVSTSPATPMKNCGPGAPFKPTTASVCRARNMVAVSLTNVEDETGPGRIDILAKDLRIIRRIKKAECVDADHVQWSDDCGFLVAVCEEEGAIVPGGVFVADFMADLLLLLSWRNWVVTEVKRMSWLPPSEGPLPLLVVYDILDSSNASCPSSMAQQLVVVFISSESVFFQELESKRVYLPVRVLHVQYFATEQLKSASK